MPAPKASRETTCQPQSSGLPWAGLRAASSATVATTAPRASIRTPLGLQYGGHRTFDFQAFQQRVDHGGAGNYHQGAEQQGGLPGPAHDVMRGGRTAGDRHQPAHKDQLPDGVLGALQAPELQVQPAFEKNHRHGESGQDVERRTESGRVDDARTVRPAGHAGGQQQNDARNAQVVRHGLGDHAHGQRQGDGQPGVVKKSRPSWVHFNSLIFFKSASLPIMMRRSLSLTTKSAEGTITNRSGTSSLMAMMLTP